ncbi:MAG: DUF1016 family protein [Alphaproteobacteria bacterium]|nr:DUF1016 family protein [Alphaproteobacteria bacterium]
MGKAISFHTEKEYKYFLQEIKNKIQVTRMQTSLAVNQQLIMFYWELGRMILDKQQLSNWGDKLIEELALDLKKSFPDTQGFSRSNLHSMKKFAQAYETPEIVQALPGQLPWTHNLVLLERLKDNDMRMWYARRTLENGWSYRMLMSHIKEDLYTAQGCNDLKINNFPSLLAAPQSKLAEEILKDPYKFHFLTIGQDAHEKDIHRGLLDHVKQFLMELGQGFALYSTHYPITVSEKRFEIDLLMYHTKLHCYVVVELKRGEFQPRDAGQLNFYLSAVDDILKTPEDKPSIGLLLCEKKDRVVAEYALRDVNKPIGISEYELGQALPKEILGKLPTIEEIEAELNSSSSSS